MDARCDEMATRPSALGNDHRPRALSAVRCRTTRGTRIGQLPHGSARSANV